MQLPARNFFRSALLLALASCSGGNPAPSTTPAQTQTQTQTRPAPRVEVAGMLPSAKTKKGEATATPAADPAKQGSRGLLAWVPADALLVLRVPHVENLGEIRRRTAVGALLQNPALLMALTSPDAPLGQLLAKLHAELPELEPLLDLLPELKGDLVLGLTRLEITREEKQHDIQTPTPTVSIAFEAQSGAEELQAALDPLFERLCKQPEAKLKRIEGAWGLAGEIDACRIEIRRVGRVFTGTLARGADLSGGVRPPSAQLANFAGAAVVGHSADLNANGQGVLEFYCNPTVGWNLVREFAPQPASDALERLGLFEVQGFSLALGLGKRGMAESHSWCSPGHKDVVSCVLASAPANRDLARWIPEDATTAGLYAFDIGQLLASIAGVLPLAQRPQMERDFAEVKQATGIDLRADVFGNLGPALAMVSRGDPLAFMTGPSGICLMIEARDADRTRNLVEKLVPLLPPTLRVRTARIAGHEVSTFDVSPLRLPVAGLSLCQADGALMIATDEKLLERCLLAGAAPGVKQPQLAEALAGEGVIGASLTAAQGDLPATLTVLRKSDSGLVAEAADGSASAGAGALMVLPIVSSIAIPNLLAARSNANEAAAASTMRSIASAQAQMQSAGAVDVDGDGAGEYAFLGELNGTLPIRGTQERLDPTILPPSPRTGEDGTWTRSGYHFVVYLPTPKNGAISESKAADGRDVAANDAEIHWIAYAWPINAGQTGNKVYVLDQEGDLIVCDNATGKYSGLAQRPGFDAYWPRQNSVDRFDGQPYLGRDGQSWHSVPYGSR